MKELQFQSVRRNRYTENRLPHWQQAGALYFLTFRLADSVPASLRNEWENEREAWLRIHPEPWSSETEQEYQQRFSGAMERWLDAGHGECVLRPPDAAPGEGRSLSRSLS